MTAVRMAMTWRVVDSAGVVRAAPTPFENYGRWHASVTDEISGETPRAAIANWARAQTPRIDWTEIVPPGELTKAEAVAAQTARCAKCTVDMRKSAELDLRNPSTDEARWYFAGVKNGARATEMSIREGAPK